MTAQEERVAPGAPVAPPVALGAPGVALALATVGHGRGTLRLATLGPAGTSADDAARSLAAVVAAVGGQVDVELHEDFDDARRAVRDGSATAALVPSAFAGATRFHWDPCLALLGVVVHPTPTYGLAVRSPDAVARPVVVVASLPEVRGLVDELAPPALRRARRLDRAAASTVAAARDVAVGLADVAVCNEPGRLAHGLSWLARREGVPMPWSVFAGPAGR
ncbi:hypothetical protein [Frigoribacterium salinisoli]